MKQNNFTDTYKLLMNPTRLRILQTYMLLKEATTSQLAKELPDIAQATLYRQVKTLEKAGFLYVIRENRIRGTVEKVYALKENPLKQHASLEQVGQILDMGILSIMGAFNSYLKKEDADPAKDLYFMGTSTLMLSDAEMMAFTEKIGKIINEMMNNKPNKERKARRITFISSPCEQE